LTSKAKKAAAPPKKAAAPPKKAAAPPKVATVSAKPPPKKAAAPRPPAKKSFPVATKASVNDIGLLFDAYEKAKAAAMPPPPKAAMPPPPKAQPDAIVAAKSPLTKAIVAAGAPPAKNAATSLIAFQPMSVKCVQCGNDCSLLKARLTSKQKQLFKCNLCHTKQTELYRHFGEWPTDWYKRMADNEQQGFFAAINTLPKNEAIGYAKEMMNLYENRETFFESSGEFLPLSVWATRGYDVVALEAHAAPEDKREDPIFGTIYRIRVLTTGERGAQGFQRLRCLEGKRQRVKRVAQDEAIEGATSASSGSAAGVFAIAGGAAALADAPSSSDNSSSSSSSSSSSKKKKKSKKSKSTKKSKKSKKDGKDKKKSKEKEKAQKAMAKEVASKKARAEKLLEKLVKPRTNLQSALANPACSGLGEAVLSPIREHISVLIKLEKEPDAHV